MVSTDSCCAGFDEAAGVHHEHVGIVGARREFVAAARQNAHHDLAIDEVFRAAQTDESDLRHVFIGGQELQF